MKVCRRITTGFIAVLFGLTVPLSSAVYADTTVPHLVFREIEITGNEFVVLQNIGTGDIQHLSNYWLGYVSDDATGVTAPPVQQLPDVPLKNGQAVLLNGGDVRQTCDAVYVTKLSPTLSNTSGRLALWHESAGSFTQLTDPQANAYWGKSTSTTALPSGEIDLKQETSQYTDPVWYFDAASAQWQVGDYANCTLTTYTSPADPTGTALYVWPHDATGPPATIISLASQGTNSTPTIPAADKGLEAPQITELLPNPAGTGNDGTDEFIELYNPNAVAFDLSGFVLETGTATKHHFTFGLGTKLPARSFTAFYSSSTGLSLSNSGSQADLTDPLGTLISQTNAYGSAKDGQAWALAEGTWYWTLSPTPNAANVVDQANLTASSSKSSGPTSPGSPSSGGSVKGTSSTRSNTVSSPATSDVAQLTPIHPWTLALVVLAALLYGLYEYRVDVANRIHQFRKHRATRRTAGK
ncbi:MAG TPA: lamin tail domain-containing protein [Candidatus Saccharimonadales bacterium]|nr:lamin tail domain-containing protein [Candidatus Saccharimonadales bacterium]